MKWNERSLGSFPLFAKWTHLGLTREKFQEKLIGVKLYRDTLDKCEVWKSSKHSDDIQ